jgi:hypothetical protein
MAFDIGKAILWLHGPAGAGKSAIMQTISERLYITGCLRGSFFFKRGHTTRGHAKVLFANLAYQLALHRPDLKPIISRRVEANPAVVGKNMDVQLEELIVVPCHSLNDAAPVIFIIDGLDECEDHSVQQELLHFIADAVRNHSTSVCQNPSAFRFLIASRPEPHIREQIEEEEFQGLHHDVNIQQSFADVRIYLRREFSRIHRQHRETMRNILTPWPPPDILAILVDKSSGYFIYASMIIKFIDCKDFRPSDCLETIVHNLPADIDRPYHALDMLYTYILSCAPKRTLLLDILCVVANFTEAPYTLTLDRIEDVLGLKSGDVRLALWRLHSILQVPSNNDESFSYHHASFHDFLADPIRSREFCVHRPPQCINVARRILKAYQTSDTCVPYPFLFRFE